MQLLPYLMFNGRCKEAMEFYKESIGGDVKYNLMSEAPGTPDEMKDKIMHSSLSRDGKDILFASDMMGDSPETHGNTVTLCLTFSGSEADEAQKIFDKLSAGGHVNQPLKEQFWGDLYGDFQDKYGFTWMVNCEKKK